MSWRIIREAASNRGWSSDQGKVMLEDPSRSNSIRESLYWLCWADKGQEKPQKKRKMKTEILFMGELVAQTYTNFMGYGITDPIIPPPRFHGFPQYAYQYWV